MRFSRGVQSYLPLLEKRSVDKCPGHCWQFSFLYLKNQESWKVSWVRSGCKAGSGIPWPKAGNRGRRHGREGAVGKGTGGSAKFCVRTGETGGRERGVRRDALAGHTAVPGAFAGVGVLS